MRIMHSNARKISEYREHLNYAMQKFEVRHLNLSEIFYLIF